MNWRESLLIAIRQGTSAKDAKASLVTADPGLLHLLHTYFPESREDSSDERVTIGRASDRPKEPEPLDGVLKGLAIELWSDRAGCLFIVADEEDARRLGEPRGTVYTADELRRVVQIGDPAIVLEIHEWKRTFNARVREGRATT
ncbi:MAG: hypothetical protein HYR60_18820 [Acidobacteria bacterium]|nr:hypothetical protein [Acidobacteriota bacterium]